MIREGIQKLKKSENAKKILYVLILVFFFLYVFSLPSFSGRIFLNYITYGFLICLTLCSVLFCFLYSDLRVEPICFFLPLFMVWSFIGTVFYSKNYLEFLSLVLMTISFFSIYFAIKSINNIYKTLKLFIYACAAFSVYFCIVYSEQIIHLSSLSGDNGRLGRYFDNENQIASYMYFAFLFTVYILVFHKKKTDLFLFIPLLLFLLVGISTGSRKFFVCVFSSVLVIIIFRFIRNIKVLVPILASIIVLLILSLFLPAFSMISGRLINMFSTFFSGTSETSSLQRYYLFNYAIRLGSRELITGYGCGGFSYITGTGTYSHSNFSEILCNFGLVGLVLFYLPIVKPLLIGFKKKTVSSSVTVGICIIFLIQSFSMVFYVSKITYVVFPMLFLFVQPDLKKAFFEKEYFSLEI